MNYIAGLCILCAVSSVCVTLTVCIVICILTMLENLWQYFGKLCRRIIRMKKESKGKGKNVHRG